MKEVKSFSKLTSSSPFEEGRSWHTFPQLPVAKNAIDRQRNMSSWLVIHACRQNLVKENWSELGFLLGLDQGIWPAYPVILLPFVLSVRFKFQTEKQHINRILNKNQKEESRKLKRIETNQT